MSRRWASSASQSWASVIFCRSGVTGASPGLISITGRLEVEKLRSMATGFAFGSASRWQRTWRVVHSPGASDLSKCGSMPWSCFERCAAAVSLFLFNSLTIGLAMGDFLPGASLDPGSPVACALPFGNDLQIGQVETLSELGAVERHPDPERPEPPNPLQLLELELLNLTSQIAEALQVVEIHPVLLRLGGLGVDDGDLPGLCHALGGPVDDRLVDALLDDLVPDVVGPVDVEPLLVEPETDREGRVLDENEVGRLERHGEVIPELSGSHREPAGHHQLPEPEVLQAQGIRTPVFQETRPDVDLVVDTIGLLLLEIVREHPLRCLFLQVQVRGGALGDPRHALLEQAAAVVDGTESTIETLPVRRDPFAGPGAKGPEMIQQALNLAAEESDDPDFVAGGQGALDLRRPMIDPVRELIEGRQGSRFSRALDHRLREAKLGDQVGLNSLGSLRRRSADVREPIEGVDALEDDGLELRGAARAVPMPLEAVEHGAPESPLDRGVDRRALLVDNRLDAAVELLHAPLHGHREQWKHFLQPGQVGGIQVAGARGDQLERANHLVLVVERCADEVSDAMLDQLVLDSRPLRICPEIFHDDRPLTDDRPLVEGTGELSGCVVGGVREDARLLVA